MLELDKGDIRVAQYLTSMPSKEVLEAKLHLAIQRAKIQLEQRREWKSLHVAIFGRKNFTREHNFGWKFKNDFYKKSNTNARYESAVFYRLLEALSLTHTFVF